MLPSLRPRAVRECDDNTLLRLYDLAYEVVRAGETLAERDRAERLLTRAGKELRRRELRITPGKLSSAGLSYIV
jgi:hypothetical protein